MDKTEGMVVSVIAVCVAVILSILIVVGAQCQKDQDKHRYETYKAAIESANGSVVIDPGH